VTANRDVLDYCTMRVEAGNEAVNILVDSLQKRSRPELSFKFENVILQ